MGGGEGKPRLLDLFCGQGGCSRGYQMAGFHVTGIDLNPQPNYIGDEFHQRDALEFLREHGHEFDCIHASPPCQAYTVLKTMHNARAGHKDLVGTIRDLLRVTGRPYVIENVPGAPLRPDFILCGSMFRLATPCGAELRRHRLFETNWWFGFAPECHHGWAGKTAGVSGGWTRNRTVSVVGDHARDPSAERRKYRTVSVTGHTPTSIRKNRTITVTGATPQQNTKHNEIFETFPVASARIAMGINWMSMKGLSQAIPPAYTNWIGEQLVEHLAELRSTA